MMFLYQRRTARASSMIAAQAWRVLSPTETSRLYDALPRFCAASERWQADAGRIKTAVDGKDLSGDVAGAVAAQEEDRFR